jgi:hypothetical protein
MAAIDGDITVQNFLQYLRVSDQALALTDQLFQQSLRVGLMRPRSPNEVHRNVGID